VGGAKLRDEIFILIRTVSMDRFLRGDGGTIDITHDVVCNIYGGTIHSVAVPYADMAELTLHFADR